MPSYRNIGKLVASSGLQGHLILLHHLGKRSSLKGLNAIFIETAKDTLLPYFITSSRIRSKNETILKLEEINSKEQTGPLLQKQVWIPEPEYLKYASAFSPAKMLGFQIVNRGSEIGEILEIIEQPHQLLCRIENEGRETYIPLHEETIEKIDRKNRKLFVNLPDGLLDIYK